MSSEWMADFKVVMRPLIATAAIFTVYFFSFIRRRKVEVHWAWRAVPLVTLAVLAAGVYFEWGRFRYDRYINPHDTYHYYIGAKYSRELGYTHMYRASLVADMDGPKLYARNGTIRNLENYGYESVSTVLKDADKYRGMFPEERWQEFTKDIRFFQSIMPKYKWNRVLRDKGYNATPVWNMVARFLANRFSTDSWWNIRFLVGLDLVLIAAMLVLILAAFGWEAALFATIFFGVDFFMSYVHIKGAFLRLDWVATMVGAACMLKLGRHKTAGGLAAYSVLGRVFPLIFVYGVGAKFVWDFFKTRKLNRQYLGFFIVFTVVCLALVGLSVLDDGGVHLWKEFSEKIAMHNSDISTTRVGFKYFFLKVIEPEGGYTSFVASRQQAMDAHKVSWWFVQVVVILASFFAVRRLKDHEALAYGIVPMFFLVAPTFYYYVMLIVPFVFFVSPLGCLSRATGLAGLFGISVAAFLLDLRYPLAMDLCFILSCFLGALALYIMGAAFMTPDTKGQAATETRRQRIALAASGGLVALWLVFGFFVAVFTGVSSRASESKSIAKRNYTMLAFAGDVMFSRNVAKSIQDNNRDFTYPVSVVAPLVRKADLAFCNLECPLSGRGQKIDKRYTFNAPPESVEALTFAEFDVVSLANNHILDYGPVGLGDTVKHLANEGIAHVGLVNKDQPQRPVILDGNGFKVGYLAYTDPETPYAYAKEFAVFDTGPAKATEARCKADIAALRGKVDIVVVSMHWGIEYQLEHNERQEELGHFLIDCGADIVAGHHPHVQQAAEWHKRGIIIHSMGNFVFDQWSRPPTRISRLYIIYANKDGVLSVEYLPMEIQKGTWLVRPTAKEFVKVPRP